MLIKTHPAQRKALAHLPHDLDRYFMCLRKKKSSKLHTHYSLRIFSVAFVSACVCVSISDSFINGNWIWSSFSLNAYTNIQIYYIFNSVRPFINLFCTTAPFLGKSNASRVESVLFYTLWTHHSQFKITVVSWWNRYRKLKPHVNNFIFWHVNKSKQQTSISNS